MSLSKIEDMQRFVDDACSLQTKHLVGRWVRELTHAGSKDDDENYYAHLILRELATTVSLRDMKRNMNPVTAGSPFSIMTTFNEEVILSAQELIKEMLDEK